MNRIAGLELRDIDRLSNNLTNNLSEEIVSYVRRATRGSDAFHVHLLDVIADVAELTGVGADDVQSAFDVPYRDHRIKIDKDGFVSLVNAKKRRAHMFKGAPANVIDEDVWERAKAEVEDDGSHDNYYAVVMKVYKDMGGRTSKESALYGLAARFNTPPWVQDPAVWQKAALACDPTASDYWARVRADYVKGGGRILRVRERMAAFQPRPFDVHAPIWTVTADGFLTRDLKTIQSFIAEGAEPSDVEADLVAAGVTELHARQIVQEALDTAPLI